MTDEQYINATRRILELMSLPELTPSQGEELSRLAEAVDNYEAEHWPIGEDNDV